MRELNIPLDISHDYSRDKSGKYKAIRISSHECRFIDR